MAYDVSKLAKLAALKALAEKVKSDYAGNKERQRIQDEEIDKQLKALAARREAFARGEISADEGNKN